MNDGFLGISRLVFTALQNIGFAALVGILLSDRWLARYPSAWQTRVSRRLAFAMRVAAIVTLASGVLAFWMHCALMSDSPLGQALPAVRSMLEETDYGRAWAIGAALLLLVSLIAFAKPSEKSIRLHGVLGVALAGFALTRSNAGHPVDAGVLSIPVWADWIHLLAISTWVGTVWVAAFVVAPHIAKAPASEYPNGASFIQSLSDAATVALVALFTTGAYNAWRGVGTPGALVDSEYGKLLVLKLVFVLTAVALGGHNRFFEMPHLLDTLRNSSAGSTAIRPLKRFASVLHVESWVLVGALIVAAVLVSSPLPGTS
jgi:putative copper resistance protein D